nr:DUF2213 domain-containing protein [Halomarina salina]
MTSNAADWEGQPLLLRHPEVDGTTTTTGHPNAAPTTVGEFRSASEHSTDDALAGEVWIHAEEIGRHNGDLRRYVDDVRGGAYGEVSTSYVPRMDSTSGQYDGQRYDAIQRDLKPDHLALLPDAVGNCDVESMQCGVGRFNGRSDLRANHHPNSSPTNSPSSPSTMSDNSTSSTDAVSSTPARRQLAAESDLPSEYVEDMPESRVFELVDAIDDARRTLRANSSITPHGKNAQALLEIAEEVSPRSNGEEKETEMPTAGMGNRDESRPRGNSSMRSRQPSVTLSPAAKLRNEKKRAEQAEENRTNRGNGTATPAGYEGFKRRQAEKNPWDRRDR